MPVIKTLTFWAPWGPLVQKGIKRTETRPRSTSHRGTLGIHTALRTPEVPDPYGWIGAYMVGKWTERIDHVEPRCDCDLDAETVGDRCMANSDWSWALLEDGGAFAPSLVALMPLGVVIATVNLVDVVRTDDIVWTTLGREEPPGWRVVEGEVLVDHHQLPYGDFSPGRYVYLFDDVVELAEPVVPPKGVFHRGLWNCEVP